MKNLRSRLTLPVFPALCALAVTQTGAQCPPQWDYPFGANGMAVPGRPGSAYAVFTHTMFDEDGPGPAPPSLIVGGFFEQAGGVPAYCVARWDGQSWSPMGAGLGHEVRALMVFDPGDGPALYAAGTFSGALRRWTGAAWVNVPLPPSITNIEAAAVLDTGAGQAIYAFCHSVPNPAVDGVYRYDGSAWTRVGEGDQDLPQTPYAFVAFDEDGPGPEPSRVYVGGMRGARTACVARLEGDDWVPVGDWTMSSPTVYALAVFDSDGDGPGLPELWAGGSFVFPDGGTSRRNLARWTGSQWAPVAAGSPSGPVRVMADVSGFIGSPALLIGGAFLSVANQSIARLALCDGADYSALGPWTPNDAGPILSTPIRTVGVVDTPGGQRIVVGGYFEAIGPLLAQRIALWDGRDWDLMGRGLRSIPDLLFEANVGPGGERTLVSATGASVGAHVPAVLSRWAGNRWEALPGDFDSSILAAAELDLGDGQGPRLYCVGRFSEVDGVAAPGIARRDGEQWTPVGSTFGGTSARIAAVTTYRPPGAASPSLIAAGTFTDPDGNARAMVASWNGSQWEPLGGLMTHESVSGPSVQCLATIDEGAGQVLVAGGWFTHANGVAAASIARWDGAAWSPMGDGFEHNGTVGVVHALAVLDEDGPGPATGTLYAAAIISPPQGPAIRRVSRWVNGAWEDVATGARVTRLALYDEDGPAGPRPESLFVSGEFTSIGGVSAQNVARWDGRRWFALDGGLDAPSPLLAASSGGAGLPAGLWAGGRFTEVDGSPVPYAAVWTRCSCPADQNDDGEHTSADVQVFLTIWQFAVGTQNPRGDINGDGLVNSLDISAFLAAWLAAVQHGC